MNYAEYRKQRLDGEALTLPSGLQVRVKKVSLLDLAFNGEIPQTLNPLTDDLLDRGREIKVTAADLVKYGEIVGLIAKACLIDPPVADESDETHIALKDMDADDKLELFQWANRGASQMEKFRKEQAGDVGALQPDGHDPHAPIPSPED